MEHGTDNLKLMATLLETAGNKIYITDTFRDQDGFETAVHDWNFSQIFILADTHTRKCCLPLLEPCLSGVLYHVIDIKPGEQEKNIATCTDIWKALARGNADRNSVLINLGGGVIGDMGGFAAGTYKRGIRFMQIPTTLLAMVDAGVGGKLGIDFEGVKNLIGLFRDPEAIFISTDFLQTLPGEQMRSGKAEILKHGLIRSKTYWDFVCAELMHDTPEWKAIIEGSVEIKLQVVAEDPQESGLRKILNFGHSVGHAIESISLLHDEQPLLHGEAVAIGMLCEAFISHTIYRLSEKELGVILETISGIFPHYTIDFSRLDALLDILHLDKKNRGNSLRFSLLRGIGACDYDIPVEEKDIIASLEYYNGLAWT